MAELTLEKLAGEQTRRFDRIQVFLARANLEIVAVSGGSLTVSYATRVIQAMQRKLRQELVPLLTHCASTVNAAREAIATGQGHRGEKVWIFRK